MLEAAQKLDELVNPPILYNFVLSPKRIHSVEQARRYGANCETITHLGLYALFGVKLPSSLLAYEMLYDESRFETVPIGSTLGNIAIFGPENPAEAKRFSPEYDVTGELTNWNQGCPAQHVSIYTGETAAGEPLFIDCSHVNRHSGFRTLSQITSYPNHAFVQRWAKLVT